MRRTTLGTLMTKPLAVWGRAGVDSDKKKSQAGKTILRTAKRLAKQKGDVTFQNADV